MATEKVSLTLDERVLREARKRAKKQGTGLSAYVNDVLAFQLHQAGMLELLDELDREHGPSTPEEIAEGERTWREVEEQMDRRKRGR